MINGQSPKQPMKKQEEANDKGKKVVGKQIV
jgi:hypothetical protein